MPDGRAFCYSNANIRKGEEPEEIFRFIAFWKKTHGKLFRRLYIQDLGHDQPTIHLTNDSQSFVKLITRYAHRMLVENAISDAVRFFHIDALSSAVGIKVDFDMALLVIASGLYRRLARLMRGYRDAQARQACVSLILFRGNPR